MPIVEFISAVPGSERPQTHAVDREATGIGNNKRTFNVYMKADVFSTTAVGMSGMNLFL